MSRQKIFGLEVRIKYPDPCVSESCREGSAYKSLDRITCGDSVCDVESVQDYPITKDYVESFLASSDYKTNLQDCLESPSRGMYGDFTDLQRAVSMSPDDLESFKEFIAQKYRLKKTDCEGTSSTDEKKEGKKE